QRISESISDLFGLLARDEAEHRSRAGHRPVPVLRMRQDERAPDVARESVTIVIRLGHRLLERVDPLDPPGFAILLLDLRQIAAMEDVEPVALGEHRIRLLEEAARVVFERRALSVVARIADREDLAQLHRGDVDAALP